ncbi:hypothetical protein D9M68_752170 [compost metagenome]
MVEVDRLGVGGRALHREVQPQAGVALRGVAHEARVGQDHRVHAQVHRFVHRLAPALRLRGLGVGVERHEHLAVTRMRIGHAAGDRRVVEVQASEVARVGGVAQAQVDAVRAVVHRGLERGQAAGRADQVQGVGVLLRSVGGHKKVDHERGTADTPKPGRCDLINHPPRVG